MENQYYKFKTNQEARIGIQKQCELREKVTHINPMLMKGKL